jgi:hypothetical protein
MSFLVQMLTDIAQKIDFNKHQETTQSDHVKSIFHYTIPASAISDSSSSVEITKELEEMDIGDFYFTFVDKYIHRYQQRHLNGSDGESDQNRVEPLEKLMRLDSDPEVFAVLLCGSTHHTQNHGNNPYALRGNSRASRSLLIRCQDVLGPLMHSDAQSSCERDKNFSLLSYSFNLNPSMAKQIGIELQTIETGFEFLRKQEASLKPAPLVKQVAVEENKKEITIAEVPVGTRVNSIGKGKDAALKLPQIKVFESK